MHLFIVLVFVLSEMGVGNFCFVLGVFLCLGKVKETQNVFNPIFLLSRVRSAFKSLLQNKQSGFELMLLPKANIQGLSCCVQEGL